MFTLFSVLKRALLNAFNLASDGGGSKNKNQLHVFGIKCLKRHIISIHVPAHPFSDKGLITYCYELDFDYEIMLLKI
jgi:hypothetical protein